MARAAIYTVLLFLSVSGFAQLNDGNSFFDGTYSKSLIKQFQVKQISLTSFINQTRSTKSVFDFDHNGFLIKETIFDSSSKKVNEYRFKYNAHGDLVERENIAHDVNKTYSESFVKLYEGNRLVQETWSQLPFLTQYLYDGAGRRIQKIQSFNHDSLIAAKHVWLYDYDDKGRLRNIIEQHSDGSNSPFYHSGNTEYIYDSGGNIVRLVRTGLPNIEFSYHKNGLVKTTSVMMDEEFNGMQIVDKYSYKFWK